MSGTDLNSTLGNQLLKNLYAFARAQYNRLYKTDVNSKGKSFRDYVHDALDKHLRAPEKYDSAKSPLEYYLKYNIIRQALYNDLPQRLKKEYKLQRELSPDHVEMMQRSPEPEVLIGPDDLEASITELSDHDRKLLFAEIEEGIKGDATVEQIYLAVAHEKFNLSDRTEICKECGIAPNDFDNGKRRFITVLKRVFKKLQLNLENG